MVIASAVIAVLAALNRETLLPTLRDHLARRPQDLLRRAGAAVNPSLRQADKHFISRRGLLSGREADPRAQLAVAAGAG